MANLQEDESLLQQSWQHQLQSAFKNIDELCAYLQLDSSQLRCSSPEAARNFPFKVPLSFAASMVKGDPDDPLLRQVLPVQDELLEFPGFSRNPVGDLESAVAPGILQKYHGRALLINTGSCAINCRYCFRRNFPYPDMQFNRLAEQQAVEFIRQDSSVQEVILSGGDPLLLSDSKIQALIRQLESIGHVKRLRIHSRMPIVLPARISNALVNVLMQCSLQVVLVVHCNHANEISERVVSALNKLRFGGIALFNQAVLLKGVNDNAAALRLLSEKLFLHQVIPYYLHLLDKASGTAHFEVSDQEAKTLYAELRAKLPGYLVPKLVRERAGGLFKEAFV
jgi:EF-P beta-lysylation protein EpmB